MKNCIFLAFLDLFLLNFAAALTNRKRLYKIKYNSCIQSRGSVKNKFFTRKFVATQSAKALESLQIVERHGC